MRVDYRFMYLIIILLFSFSTAQANDYYVATNGNNGNNGTSLGQAWRTITYAVNHVNGTQNNPAIIHVAAGTYDRDHEGDFPVEINSNAGYIEIEGAGLTTIIDGAGGEPWESYWAFDVDDVAALSIRDLRITNCRSGIRVQDVAGPMSFSGLQLDNFLRFPDNTGTSGFIFDQNGGSINMDNVTINDAISDQNGGGIFIDENDGNITLTNITMDSPTARWSNGGALWARDSGADIILTNWNITNPWANDDGGTFYINQLAGNLTASGIHVENSNARYNHGGVFYVYNVGASVEIENCNFTSPRGDDHGGSIYVNNVDENCSIDQVVITDGTGTYGRGGAFYVNDIDGNTEISNITINNVSAGNEGGAMYLTNIDGSLDLDNVSITDTRCEWSSGGGIYVRYVDNGINFNHVVVSNGFAEGNGGGIYLSNLQGDLRFQDVAVENCDAFWGDGGGIYLKTISNADSIVFDELALCGNTCFGGHGSNSGGGGMYFYHSNNDDAGVRISNFSLIGNSTGGHDAYGGDYHAHCHCEGECQGHGPDHGGQGGQHHGYENHYGHHGHNGWGHGGGMFLYKLDNVSFANGTILWNETVDDGAYHEWHGGGLYLYQIDDINIENVVVWENLARGNGGGIYVRKNSGSLRMFNVGFIANFAEASDQWNNGLGGGFYYEENTADGGPDFLIRNGLFVENYASNHGGAIHVQKGDIDLVNLTVARNTASGTGESIYAYNNQDVNLYNSIVWANGDGTGEELTIYGNDLEVFYSDVEGPDRQVVDGPGNININPYYYNLARGRYNVRFGSRTLDAGMPDDPGAEGYVAAYADYSHEADPNYGQINMGFWGMLTGNGLDCDYCDGAGAIGGSGGGQAGGGSQPGGELIVDGGFGGAAGGVSSEALLLIIQDQYVFMGVPVIPNEDQIENDPETAFGDDVSNTVPQWDPDEMLQTWRFSRWTQNYPIPQQPGNFYTGYLRYNQDEPHPINEDYGDPPPIIPGRGYWFVYNYGARLEAMISVDVSKFMLDNDDYILPLDPWTGEGRPALNMMANPWPFPIDWAEIELSDSPDGPWITTGEAAAEPYNWIEDWAYCWDHPNEEYVTKNRRIEVWEGMWMVVHSTDTLWVKFSPRMIDMDVPAVELDELDEVLDWSLLLTAERTDRLQVDYHNWIGVGAELTDGKDKYDAYQLSPQAKEAIFLRSRLLNEADDRLTYDFRANDLQPGEPKAWLMEAWFFVDDPAIPQAYPIDVSIKWPTISSVPDNIQFQIHQFNGYTFDPDPGLVLVDNMRNTEEIILNVNGNVNGYPEYKVKRFWISATEVAGITETPYQEIGLPTVTQLSSIAPNPFNNSTTIHFDIAQRTNINLKIYNALGQELGDIHKGSYNPGYHQFTWNANNVSSGVYFIKFEADGVKHSLKKVVLLK